jgi:hypothetical protein
LVGAAIHQSARTRLIHTTRLKEDMLVSKSKHIATEDLDFNGSVVVWQWLDLNRFAPEGLELREHLVKPSYWVSFVDVCACVWVD